MNDSRNTRYSRNLNDQGDVSVHSGIRRSITNRDSSDVIVKRLVIDRLAYVLPLHKESHRSLRSFEMKRIRKRLDVLQSNEVCVPAFVRRARYRFNINVPLSDRHKAFVQIGALNPDRQNGDIRIELNPARLKDGHAKYFHNFMCKLLGKETYRELWGRALVNVLHPAVDIFGVELDDLLVHYSNARQRSAFVKRTNKQGVIEGYNFGSMSSDYIAAVYDKKAERVHRAVEAIARAGRLGNTKMKEAKIKQFYDAVAKAPYIRIELRGKKMRGVPLTEIVKLTNRFERFRFVDLNSVKSAALPRRVRDACVSVFRDKGHDAALDLFRGNKHFAAIESWLDESQPPWWKPDQLWEQAAAELKKTGLFPETAFDNPSAHGAAAEKHRKSSVTQPIR